MHMLTWSIWNATWAEDCILPLWHLSARSLPTLGGVVTPLNCFASVEGFAALYVYSGPKNFRWITAAKLKKMVVWQFGVRGDNVLCRVKGFDCWHMNIWTVRRCPTRCSGLFVGVIKWSAWPWTITLCLLYRYKGMTQDSRSWAF